MAAGITGLTQTAVAALVTQSEPVLEAKWHQPFSEPVRHKIAPQLAVALIASGLAYVEAAPFAEAVTESRWHQPFSEPVRTRWFPAAEQQTLAWQPAPSPFVATGWFNWLSEPVRAKPRLPEGEQQFIALQPWPDVRIGWYAPLAEPVRVRPKILVPAYEQQFQPFDEDIIFVDRWFAWWSEPVRIKPALRAASQQVLAFDPFPFAVTIGWAPQLSEPVRIKPALLAALQRYEVSYDPQPFPFLGGGGGWLEEEPARRIKKPGAPREVAPKAEPPTFADVLGSQQPTRLADVLGSAFAPRLDELGPPALDLWIPPSVPGGHTAQIHSIAPAALDAIADEIDARDAMEALHALDELDRQEREALIAAVLAHFASKQT
jgi:hypothetical protein